MKQFFNEDKSASVQNAMIRRIHLLNLLFAFGFTLALPAADEDPSRKIDALIGQDLREKKLAPNPPVSDEVFLKRIYLEIAGRLPNADEARTFLDSRSAGKRDDLIDRLLASDDYAHNFFNYWADILRIRARRGRGSVQSSGEQFARYLLASLKKNTPYDVLVREMITARGFSLQNGATGFFMRDARMPLDHMANTVRVFLGVRLECAQCHDDPFDDWTQRDFYRMAAFTHGQGVISMRRAGAMKDVHARITRVEDKEERRNLNQMWNKITAAFAQNGYYGKRFHGRGILKLPHDYQYDDAKPGDRVNSRTLFEETLATDDTTDLEKAYANWMTSPENRMFTRAIVNRLWERVMGVRIWGTSTAESIDDLSEDSKSLHPELFEFLVGRMVEFDYDLKAFLGMLYKTRSYQRSVSTSDPPVDIRGYVFQGPVLNRASAEQIWDSLVYLINPMPNEGDWYWRIHKEVQRRCHLDVWEGLRTGDPDKLFQKVRAVLAENQKAVVEIEREEERIREAHSGSERELAEKLRVLRKNSRGINQIIHEIVHDPARRRAGTDKPFKVPLPSGMGEMLIREDMRSMQANPNAILREELGQVQKQLTAQGARELKITDRLQLKEYTAFRSQARAVCRASGIDLPAPPGHFLRKFGQSDRVLIENANRKAAPIQPLALMNEQTIDLLRSPFSPLSLAVARQSDLKGKIETIYLSLLARRPTDHEWEILRREAKRRGDGFERDVIVALMNSPEFLFIR